jgi:hypothetical protein
MTNMSEGTQERFQGPGLRAQVGCADLDGRCVGLVASVALNCSGDPSPGR